MSIPNHQWKYLIVGLEDGQVVGTDDQKIAHIAAQDDTCVIIEVPTCQVLNNAEGHTMAAAENIAEQSWFKFD